MESDVDNDAVHERRRILQLSGLNCIYIAFDVFWHNLMKDGFIFLNHTYVFAKLLKSFGIMFLAALAALYLTLVSE